MGEKRMGEKRHAKAVSAFVAYLMLFSFSAQALSATITSWGIDDYNQVSYTPSGTGFTAIAAGNYHSLVLDGVNIIPLPASAWMGIVLLGAIGTMSVARKRLCAA